LDLPSIHKLPIIAPIEKVSKPQHLYHHYNSVLDNPSEISRIASLTGIETLQHCGVVPPHVDVIPAIEGRNKRKMLRPLKSRIFDNSLRIERGTLFEQNHRAYDSFVKFEKPSTRMKLQYLQGFVEQDEYVNSNISEFSDSSLMKLGNVINPETVPGWVYYIINGKLDGSTFAYQKFQQNAIDLEINHVANWFTENLIKLAKQYSSKFF
jgi:hypothetical protein